MTDLLHVTPHADEQRSLAELRSEFRSEALSNLRAQYAGRHPIGWQMIGDPATARDHYSAEQWAMELDCHLLAPVEQDFGLSIVPDSVSVRMEKEAIAALEHDSVTWADGTEGVVDHDAPACCDVGRMTDEELCDYVDEAIKESGRE